jgi:hypothetical protein
VRSPSSHLLHRTPDAVICHAVDTANAVVQTVYPGLELAKGQPGIGSRAPGAVHQVWYDTAKAASVLGIGHGEGVDVRYRKEEETARDVLVDAKEKGWKLGAVRGVEQLY